MSSSQYFSQLLAAQIIISAISLIHSLFYLPTEVKLLRLQRRNTLQKLQLVIALSILSIQAIILILATLQFTKNYSPKFFLERMGATAKDDEIEPIFALVVVPLFALTLVCLNSYIFIKYESLIPAPVTNKKTSIIFNAGFQHKVSFWISIVTAVWFVASFALSEVPNLMDEKWLKYFRISAVVAFDSFAFLVDTALELILGSMIFNFHQKATANATRTSVSSGIIAACFNQRVNRKSRSSSVNRGAGLVRMNHSDISSKSILFNDAPLKQVDANSLPNENIIVSPVTQPKNSASFPIIVSNKEVLKQKLQQNVSTRESLKIFGTITIICITALIAYIFYFLSEFSEYENQVYLTLAVSVVLNGVQQALRLINILQTALNNINDASKGVGLSILVHKNLRQCMTSGGTPSEFNFEAEQPDVNGSRFMMKGSPVQNNNNASRTKGFVDDHDDKSLG